LEEKGIPYSRRVVNLKNKTEVDWYKQNVNPLGKVPAIRDSDGTTLYESEIINEACLFSFFFAIPFQYNSLKKMRGVGITWYHMVSPGPLSEFTQASWPDLSSPKEYLEQKFDCGPNLMPEDAAGCAHVKLWNHHLNNKSLGF
jgi:hypothetical protein